MKHSFTLIVLFSLITVDLCTVATDQNYLVIDKTIFSLRADCNALLKECDRISYESEKTSKDFQVFNEQLKQQGGSSGFLNRSILWVKSIIFTLDNNLKSIHILHGNCLCLSGKISLNSDLKDLFEKTNDKYFQTRNRIIALKTSLITFKNKIQPNLN